MVVSGTGTVWALDYAAVNAVVAPVFANITGRPTTLTGYGITDGQPLDGDLTTIAALTATTDSFLQSKAGAWAARTVAQVKTDLTLSGTNTGDQTIAITGDVTGTGTGSFAATIAANAVTNTKAAQMATATIKGRATAGTGNAEDLTASQAKAVLAITNTDVSGLGALATQSTANLSTQATGTLQAAQMPILVGDVTTPGASLSATIAAGAVTLAKQANLAANSIIGNATGSSAAPTAVPMSSLAAASSVVIRDANANAQNNNTRQGYSTTATAAGTTVLTVASTFLQFFTGTTVQTITLPDVTTLVQGHQFYIKNNSTGLLTINSSGGGLIRIVGPNTRCIVTCQLITGATAASWSAMYVGVSIADGKVLSANNNLTLSGTDGNSLSIGSVGASVSGANTGDQTITLTSDVTGTGTGSFAATLATVNANVGSFGLAASVAQFTTNAKGLITAAANVAISITSAAISDLTTVIMTLAGTQTITGNKTFTGSVTFSGALIETDSNFTLIDDVDPTKKAQFQISGVTTATTRTISVPDASGTLAILNGGAAQTFTGAVTFGTTATFQGASITVGNNSVSSTLSLASGVTASGSTKAVSIGTLGAAGSTTTITVGPVSGAGTVAISAGVTAFSMGGASLIYKLGASTAKSALATLTAAEVLSGIIEYSGLVASLTMPTGTTLDAGISTVMGTDQAFKFSVINTGSGTVTMVANTGITIVGSAMVAVADSGRFMCRRTAAATYILYRIS